MNEKEPRNQSITKIMYYRGTHQSVEQDDDFNYEIISIYVIVSIIKCEKVFAGIFILINLKIT